jgi:hypothetical protein
MSGLVTKRKIWLRVAVVLAVATYAGLLLMSALSVLSASDLHANAGDFFPGFWSGRGLLVTLLVGLPFAAIAAWKNWNRAGE